MAFRFGGLAQAAARGMQGASEIERQRKADAEQAEAREIQKMAQMMAFREMGLMPESEAPTVSDDPVIQGFDGLKPKAVASVRTPRTDPNYKPIGTAGGQRYVQGPKPAEIVAQRQQEKEVRQRLATLKAIAPELSPDAANGIAIDPDAFRAVVQDRMKPQTSARPSAPRTLQTSSGIKQWNEGAQQWEDTPFQTPERSRDSRPVVVQGADGGPIIVDPRAGTSSPVVDAETGERPQMKPPGNIATAFRNNKKQVSVIRDAINGVKARPDATGFLRGIPVIGSHLDQRVDPEGVTARANVSDIGSMVIHERSGAAVTISEYPRIAPLIPSVRDDHETVIKKLTRMAEIIEEDNLAMAEQYPALQGRPSNPRPAVGKAMSPADAAIAKRDPQFAQWLKSQGYEVP